MKIILVFIFSLLCSVQLFAQYWFGPRVGANRTNFVYQESTYEADSFDVADTYNWEAGIAMTYTATDRYAVHTELYYENIKKLLKNKPNDDFFVRSRSENHFITVPLMLRVSLGKEPVHWFVNFGPRVSYWLGGNGRIDLVEFEEFQEGPAEWDKVAFQQENSDTQNGIYAIPEANRLQFGLIGGAGVYLDLVTGGRLMIDGRYSFGHSNMGFNQNDDFIFQTYKENFRYSHHSITLSIAYLFEYDVKLQSKGMSTVDESNKRKKKKR